MRGVLQSKAPWLLSALIVVAATASAQPFTAEEEAELFKIYTAHVEVGSAQTGLSNVYRDNLTTASRAAIGLAMVAGWDAQFDCAQAHRHLLGIAPAEAPAFGTQTIEQLVQRGVDYALSCDAKVADFANKLRAIGVQAATNFGNRLDQTVNLETFRSLPFEDNTPESYPNLVGPHGDYPHAAESLLASNIRFLEASKSDVVWFQRAPGPWPTTEDATAPLPPSTDPGYALALQRRYGASGLISGLREINTYGPAFVSLTARGTLIEAGVESPFDTAQINTDETAGSGIRTREFFVTPYVSELINNPKGTGFFLNFAQRPMQAGANGNFEVVHDGQGMMLSGWLDWQEYLAMAGVIDWQTAAQRMSLMGKARAGAVPYSQIHLMTQGWMRNANTFWGLAWEDSQAYNFFVTPFFHAPPLPPPPNGCPAGQTCQPPDPPPPQCSVFDAQMVLVDNTHAEARCVPRP